MRRKDNNQTCVVRRTVSLLSRLCFHTGTRCLLLVLVSGLVSLAMVHTSQATANTTDFVWNGQGTTFNWSSSQNWEGENAPAPHESLGSVLFPSLTGVPCAAEPMAGFCVFGSDNDLSELTVESLQIDDSENYTIFGEPLILGAGGLSASPTTFDKFTLTEVDLPLTLDAPQTWSIDGGGEGTSNGVYLGDLVTGATDGLNVAVSSRGMIDLGANVEVGAVSVEGADAQQPGVVNGSFNLFPGAELNASDGNPVSFSHVFVFGTGSIGPFTGIGAELYLGSGGYPAGEMQTTSASLDSTSAIDFDITGAGSTAGTDYAQLTSTGPINLGGSSVSARVGEPCPQLTLGQTYTLISTTGVLTGIFGNASEGAEIPIIPSGACEPRSQNLRLAYHRTGATQTVTAMVVAPPTSTELITVPSAKSVTNQQVSLIATIEAAASAPSGIAEFTNNGVIIPGCASVPIEHGKSGYTAKCRTTFAASDPVPHLSAAFIPAGGVNLQSSTSNTISLSVAPAQTTIDLDVSALSPLAGNPVSYTATVIPSDAGPSIPTGAVQFDDSDTELGECPAQPLISGEVLSTASCQVRYPGSSVHEVDAVYLGDANFTASTSSPQTVSVHLEPQHGNGAVLGSSTTTQPSLRSRVLLMSMRFAVRLTIGTDAKLNCTPGEGCAGSLTLSIITRAHRGARAKHVPIGSAIFAFAAGSSRIVKITFNDAGRALLHRHARIDAIVTIVQLDPDGNERQVVPVQLSRAPHTTSRVVRRH